MIPQTRVLLSVLLVLAVAGQAFAQNRTFVSISASPVTLPENSDRPFVFTLTRTGANTSLSVSLFFEGSALPGVDYRAENVTIGENRGATVVFPSGVMSVAINVFPIADDLSESLEAISVGIAPSQMYNISSALATVTITNVVPLPLVSVVVAPRSLSEGDPTPFAFVFMRQRGASEDLVVTFTIGGTARLGVDYTTTFPGAVTGTNTFTFERGLVNNTIFFTIVADEEIEVTESIVVTILASSSYTLGNATAEAVILSDTIPDLSISVSPVNLTESSGRSFNFMLARSGASTTFPLPVVVVLTGSATLGVDYTTSIRDAVVGINTITIPRGQSSTNFTVTPLDDAIREPAEFISFVIQEGTFYKLLNATSFATVLIIDDDQAPQVGLIAQSATFQDENYDAPFVVELFKRPAESRPLNVTFVASGSATYGADYTIGGASFLGENRFLVSFEPQETSKSIYVYSINDSEPEPNETIQLLIEIDPDYEIVNRSVVLTIINDDSGEDPVVSVYLAQPGSRTPEDDGATIEFVFLRETNNLIDPLTVFFSVGGTTQFAQNAETDYIVVRGASTFSATSGTIVIPAGASSKSITLRANPDRNVEADETIILTVLGDAFYDVSSSNFKAQITIVNDDGLPKVSVVASGASSITEGSGATSFSFTRAGPIDSTLSVSFFLNGTATPSLDYIIDGATIGQERMATVVFPVGSERVTVLVSPLADVLVEPRESVIFSLVNNSASFTAVFPSNATVFINDVPPSVPVVSISADNSVTEGRTLSLRVSRSGFLNSDVAVVISLGGLATYRTDYTLSGAVVSGARAFVRIPSRSTFATFSIATVDDLTPEASETILLSLVPQSTYSIDPARSSKEITIIDNDPV